MVDERPSSRDEKWIIGRALSIPVLAFLVALLLIYTRPPPGDPGSTRWIEFPEVLGGENLRRALRSTVVVFGLSSLPGGLIGIALGSLIARSSKLAMASLRFLRIGQWAPFLLWWPLAELLLLLPPNQPIPRYFLVWTIAVPAVALTACYHYLCTRFTLGLEWRKAISEVARVTILQGLFISLMLVLLVWPQFWMVYPWSGRSASYAMLFSVGVFLIIVKWVYRSSLDYTGGVRKAILLGELSSRNQASLWGVMLLVLLCLVGWQLLSATGYLRVSPASVFNAFSLLISGADIWKDMRVSLFEIFGGLIISGGIALVISTGLSRSSLKTLMLPLLPLTYVVPIVVPPALLGSFVINLRNWSTVCVAVLSFFPFMQGLWGLRDQPLLCRILLAVDDALPFAFVGIVYGEAMAATAGLGFWMVVATAKNPTAEPVATFIVTFGLLAVLSSALRFVVRTLYFREGSREILLAPETP